MGLSFEPGEVLCAKYKVEGVLGSGGMGIVIAAEHLLLGERVALKILRPDLVDDPRLVGRFEREARAAAKIRSEHVARVSDVGRLDSGLPFMVMEYLHGCDLAAYLEQRGPLQLQEAADYLLQACEAIAEAHALGIVHRDLKPENLFLTTLPDGSHSIKVLDFGISKIDWLHGSSGQHATMPQAMMGSPLYMSPEQLRSASAVDARADVWALGVILYELLTGETPFIADTLPQLCTAVLEAPPTPLATHRADLPPAVGELIAGCLRKARDERIATVAELARALAAFAPEHARLSAERIARIAAGGKPPTAQTAVPVAAVTAAVEQAPTPAPAPERSRRTRVIALAAALVVMAAGTLAWLQTRAPARDTRASHAASPPAALAKPEAARAPPPPAFTSPPPRLPSGVTRSSTESAGDAKAREARAGSPAFREARAVSRRPRSAPSPAPEQRRKPAAKPPRAVGVDPDRPLGGRL